MLRQRRFAATLIGALATGLLATWIGAQHLEARHEQQRRDNIATRAAIEALADPVAAITRLESREAGIQARLAASNALHDQRKAPLARLEWLLAPLPEAARLRALTERDNALYVTGTTHVPEALAEYLERLNAEPGHTRARIDSLAPLDGPPSRRHFSIVAGPLADSLSDGDSP